MTTATASTAAPTEAEVRAMVKAALDNSSIDSGEWVQQLVAPLCYEIDPSLRGPSYAPGIWDDLRPSQAERLVELVEAIYEEGQELENEVTRKITEAVVRAAMTFASENPDAPRAAREAVTA